MAPSDGPPKGREVALSALPRKTIQLVFQPHFYGLEWMFIVRIYIQAHCLRWSGYKMDSEVDLAVEVRTTAGNVNAIIQYDLISL